MLFILSKSLVNWLITDFISKLLILLSDNSVLELLLELSWVKLLLTLEFVVSLLFSKLLVKLLFTKFESKLLILLFFKFYVFIFDINAEFEILSLSL